MFLPRKVRHGWTSTADAPAKVIDVYQPAGAMEDFFRRLGEYREKPIHEVLTTQELHDLFKEHGMELLGPPLTGKWGVDDDGRAVLKS